MTLFSLLPAAILLCWMQISDAFIRAGHPSSIASTAAPTTPAVSNTKLFNAANALIRKAKMKEVDKLREAVNAEGSSHYINKFLETKKFVDLYGGPIPFVENVLNRYTSVTIMPEYSKKAKTGFILGLPEPEIMGVMFRDAGARSVVVCLDKKMGGASLQDVERFVRDQSRSRKLLPGPISVVWHDNVVDNLQIAQAASLGVGAITLNSDLVDSDELTSQIAYCKELDIEPIIMIRSEENAKFAIEKGARVICMHNLDEKEMIEIRKKLPSEKDIVYMGRLRPASQFSIYAEIDQSWVLRDNGFQVVWPSPDSIYSTGFLDLYAILQAMKAKASAQFISPRQFMMERKKEGAKEYLGDILY